MKKTLLLCGCQSYFGVDLLKRVFKEQQETIDGEPPIKLVKINLFEKEKENVDESDKIENFIVEFTYSTSLKLYKLIAFLASDIEGYQVSEHGDAGGFWIIDDKIPCKVVSFNTSNVEYKLSVSEQNTFVQKKCLLIDDWVKLENGMLYEKDCFLIEF